MMSEPNSRRITEFFVCPPKGEGWQGQEWLAPLRELCSKRFPDLKINIRNDVPPLQGEEAAVYPIASAPHPSNKDAMIILPITDETRTTMALIKETVEAFDPVEHGEPRWH